MQRTLAGVAIVVGACASEPPTNNAWLSATTTQSGRYVTWVGPGNELVGLALDGSEPLARYAPTDGAALASDGTEIVLASAERGELPDGAPTVELTAGTWSSPTTTKVQTSHVFVSPRIVFDGHGYVIGWEENRPRLAYRARTGEIFALQAPSTTGIGPFLASDREGTVVAYIRDEQLVVRRLTDDGAFTPERSFGAKVYWAGITAGDAGVVAVWMTSSSHGRKLMAQRMTSTFEPIDEPAIVAEGSMGWGDSHFSVAGDAERFAVTWSKFDNQDNTYTVHARLFAQGTLQDDRLLGAGHHYTAMTARDGVLTTYWLARDGVSYTDLDDAARSPIRHAAP